MWVDGKWTWETSETVAKVQFDMDALKNMKVTGTENMQNRVQEVPKSEHKFTAAEIAAGKNFRFRKEHPAIAHKSDYLIGVYESLKENEKMKRRNNRKAFVKKIFHIKDEPKNQDVNDKFLC